MKCIGIIICFVLLGVGCHDVFEKDISEKDVELKVPADSVETYHTTLTFVWGEREGATGYRLVIVSPSFDKAVLYVLDTLVESYQYTCDLKPGKYEWGVLPENSAYKGIYKKRGLTILEKVEDDSEEL